MNDCPGCKPGSPIRAFTAEDYQRAMDLLASRTDIDDAKRAEVKEFIDDHRQRSIKVHSCLQNEPG
ncbi:hypothetical protein vBPaeMUSP18_13 [Pseudomonas phage vB_PaeM_USP_18]|nr:hypothetical protein vBPaeMUSP18_13 [Pseudomonas phage vB_PaeM_USP_18]QLI49529.1 hypothetical protein vBPaeMUSP25_13 [Pseudomonas phage vB_PaeM_USP_25]